MRRQAQRGFSLLEIMAALAIAMFMLMGLTAIMDSSLQDTKGQQTAQYQATFTSAASRYLDDNYAALLTANAVGTTVALPLATLQGLGAYLPLSFAPQNAYQQIPCMLVRKTSLTRLEVLLVTEGGDPIPDADIGYVAANTGIGGGAITLEAGVLIARGAYGSWLLNEIVVPKLSDFISANCSGTAATNGNLATALFYGSGQSGADFLYRSPVGGDARFNRMNTPIGMGGAAIAAIGAACGTTLPAVPSIAMTATGRLLTCDIASNTYADPSASQWKEPVADLAALQALPLSPLGDVRVLMNSGRAFMSDGGGGWVGLAVDVLGNFDVPNNITVGSDVIAGNNINALRDINALSGRITGNSLVSTTHVEAGQDIYTDTGDVWGRQIHATVAAVAPSYSIGGVSRTTGTGLGGTHLAGSQCNYYDAAGIYIQPWGTIVMDQNGITMFCKSSIPNPIPGPTAADNPNGMFVYQNNTTTPP